MTMEEVEKIYGDMRSSKWQSLVDDVIKAAVRYARIRVDWFLATPEDRRRNDKTRSIAHTAFIDSLEILRRNMDKAGEDISWRERIGQGRKEIGDFACRLHCLLGIMAR
jgi:hypothetical protein